MELILASHSPRRRELLERMGLTKFQVLVSAEPEALDQTLPPETLAERLAEQKARSVQRQAGEGALIIAADTVVVYNGKVLGKPTCETSARHMLATLSGHRHQVYTGVTVLRGSQCHTEHEMTEVSFRPIRQEEIDAYIATGEPADKAGGYGIQGYGCLFVTGILGDYYNVMGLPVCRLGQMLKRFGVDCLTRLEDAGTKTG